jgi:hypothetical protein
MYLYVKFCDTWGAYNNMMYGIATNSKRRVKRIKLTDEQIKELQPRKVGMNGNQEMYEELFVLSIQEE